MTKSVNSNFAQNIELISQKSKGRIFEEKTLSEFYKTGNISLMKPSNDNTRSQISNLSFQTSRMMQVVNESKDVLGEFGKMQARIKKLGNERKNALRKIEELRRK